MNSSNGRSDDHSHGIEIPEVEVSGPGSYKLRDIIPGSEDHLIPHVERGMLNERPRKKRFLDFLKARPSRDWFLKFGIIGRLSRSSFLRRNASPTETDGSPPPPPAASSAPSRLRSLRSLHVRFVRKINLKSLAKRCMKWAIDPKNMALFIWSIACIICLIFLALFSLGAFNGLIENRSDRKEWAETVNQILNALFTIMCLYHQPTLLHHLFLLYRWRSKDIAELRKGYCKHGNGGPHERAHIMLVVFLLNLTCFGQYVSCAFYWAYDRPDRPDLEENISYVFIYGCPIVAALYTVFGPLGKKYEPENDGESLQHGQEAIQVNQIELRESNGRAIVTRPEWIGGLFDCGDDKAVACLSFFCTFCVFGWNVERLGFGNMYVHIVTFILLCIAPFLVFNAAALNIDEEIVKFAVGISGIVLCLFGLLYGGFWRIQMRKKFKLPANPFCFGYPAITDCMQWLFCSSCSLAQEVRTANFYDIEEDSFYSTGESGEGTRSGDGHQLDGNGQPVLLLPLPREGGLTPFFIKSDVDSPLRSQSFPTKIGLPNGLLVNLEEERWRSYSDNNMAAPLPLLIQVEDYQHPHS